MTFIAFLIGIGVGVACSIAIITAFFIYQIWKAKKENWRATPKLQPILPSNVIAFPNTAVSASQ